MSRFRLVNNALKIKIMKGRKTKWQRRFLKNWAALMYGREIIFSPVCPHPPKKKTSPLEYGDSGICAISNLSLIHIYAIVREEIEKMEQLPWQYYVAIPDLKSTGIKDGKRYMGWAAVIRAINTVDAVTAESVEIPWETLCRMRDLSLIHI